MTTSKFYNFITMNGIKTVNINNIAALEDFGGNTKVTLNVKSDKEVNISFIATGDYAKISADIIFIDQNQL